MKTIDENSSPLGRSGGATVYFDNAATSFPKPESVVNELNNYLLNIGANPGRSGHSLSIKAGEVVFGARKQLAGMFGVKNPMRVVFGFNATDALNLAIKGMVQPGDHVITSAMEHNSTIRPLKQLEADGIITLSIAEADMEGRVSARNISKLIRSNTSTVVVNHVSNVNGAIQPIAEIGEICRENNITFIVDGAQSGGYMPVNITDAKIDIYAFTGHKGLYGTQGTGGLIFADTFDYKKVKPLRAGGTGSRSSEIIQPEFLPDRFESGTLNVGGIAALAAGVKFVKEKGIENIRKHEQKLANYFHEKASVEVPGFKSFGFNKNNTGIVSFRIGDISVSEIAGELSEKYGIMCRHGLHCAPLAHKSLGSFPEGTVRFGFGVFNTFEEADVAVKALAVISNR